MYYHFEEDKAIFYKLSIVFKCLIAFVFILSFTPFLYWLFISKTLLQKIIMIVVTFIFVFLIPAVILLSNKKIEILKKKKIIKISTYIYKYLRVKEVMFDEIEKILLRAMVKRGRGYMQTWWQISLKTINNKYINLFATTSEMDAKNIIIDLNNILDKGIENQADSEILESKDDAETNMYILRIKDKEGNQLKRPKNIYKEDYGKRINYKWFNINGLEMTMYFLFLYILIRQSAVIWHRGAPGLLTSIKLTLLFVVYFVLRYIWIVVVTKGIIEIDKKGIRIRKNILILPKWQYFQWQDLKNIKINSRIRLVFVKTGKSLSIKASADKIFWLKNEIDNFIRIRFL